MKKNLDAANLLYPMPTVLVGTVVKGRPNFLTIAHVGIMNHGHPQYVSIGLAKIHYSNQGIHEHKAFSINFPSEDMVELTDCVGMISGKKTDKSGMFELFEGELAGAPMIVRCPVNMECRLHDVVDFPTHEVFIGEIVASYADEEVLTGGVVDYAKVRPLLFDMPRRKYWRLGEPFADCWSVGKRLRRSLTGED